MSSTKKDVEADLKERLKKADQELLKAIKGKGASSSFQIEQVGGVCYLVGKHNSRVPVGPGIVALMAAGAFNSKGMSKLDKKSKK